ncbi:UDP:flavonoid glycosyltransferase YjiC (YdhE family) [Nocardioides sp. BE266]|uniref:glycosyltransferase n=1 Tax=Nocardioides sp. BE266 TaxID=2817725 RepID=UPI00285613C3|nr:glycosyltransferase [Nocardioides sp. BE266]MDR7252520.1 UDP:flavonoid glycosyltransferase YjiC (YdhE family) [Nocardioides sp. BE266]
MRLLITFVGGLGHLAPLLPVARAARDAGHEVAIAGSGGLVPRIEEAGFAAFATSPRPHHDQTPTSRARDPLEVMDARSTEVEFAENFADRGARRMAGAVPDVIAGFHPDLVLRDETDLGTTIAAERADVPVATHVVLASGLLVRPELVAPRLDVVRAEHGLPADPGLTRLTSGLVLSDVAPGFRSPDAPLQVEPLHYRSAAVSDARQHEGRPSIYVTLGTIFNKGSGDLFDRLLTGLRDLDADVLLTIGRELDPADLGAQPPHVRVERFVPQGDVLPTVDLVVSHAGSGSLMAALAHGLPSLLLPLGAD